MTILSRTSVGGLVGAVIGFALPYTLSIIKAVPLAMLSIANPGRFTFPLAQYAFSATLSPYAIPLAIAGGVAGAGITAAYDYYQNQQTLRPHTA